MSRFLDIGDSLLTVAYQGRETPPYAVTRE